MKTFKELQVGDTLYVYDTYKLVKTTILKFQVDKYKYLFRLKIEDCYTSLERRYRSLEFDFSINVDDINKNFNSKCTTNKKLEKGIKLLKLIEQVQEIQREINRKKTRIYELNKELKKI